METYNITSNSSGDAFGGNKIISADVFIETLKLEINDNVSLSSISHPLLEALEDFRKNNITTGIQKLNTLNLMKSLDREASLAIASLRILMSDDLLKEDEDLVSKYSPTQDYSQFAKELTNASILKLIEIRKGKDNAHDYFKKLPEQIIPQYVYIKRLATKAYVHELVERKSSLSDFILSVVVN
ncbi:MULTISPECIES: hypothetical protein [Pseudoalteromonas]|uniref:hypothetical protein n=1 Tax=Pseudoalteromonas TaxID=53246 RepID=UPI0030017B51